MAIDPKRKPTAVQHHDAPPPEPERTPAAADAAVAEVAAEAADNAATPEEDDADKVTVTHAGVEFQVSRKRVDAVQYRRYMQQRRDAVALDWLIGEGTVERLLAALEDEDGIVDSDAYVGIFAAIGEAMGAGNS